jgi:hypothetical protein
MGSSHYLAHDDVPEATDSDDISICTTEEIEKYESLRHREFAHTRIYDVNLLERAGLDEELPTILQTIGWGKLYDEPRQGSCLLNLEFLTTFETVEKGRKLFVKFCLFDKSFSCDLSHFSELLDFSKSSLPESTDMRNFNKVEFSDTISRKSARLMFSDIHNPSLRFLHRLMSFTLFPMAELHSVTTIEIKCLFLMVNKIKYTPVADIVDYFTNVSKISGPIECTSLVTRIAMNLGYLDLTYIEGDVPIFCLDHFVHAHILHEEPDYSLTYIEGDVPIFCLDHFVHAHILHEEPDYSVFMLYGRKVIRLPNPALQLFSYEGVTLQFDQMGEAHHSFTRPPHTHERACMEVAHQTMTTP